MKNKISKRILAGILTFGMAASLMPATAFAARDVDVDPGSGTLPVEYFSSTMYRWDEAEANKVTAEADRTEGEYYQQTTVRYNEVAAQETSNYRETSYLHKVGEDYYPVYYTRVTERVWFDRITTYSIWTASEYISR